MSVYREIGGTRRFEYRILDPNVDRTCGWREAGVEQIAALNEIITGRNTCDDVEVREVAQVVDEAGYFVGRVIFLKFAPDTAEPGFS